MKKSFVLGFLILVALMFVLAGCTTGEARKFSRNCTDSDGGINYNVYGIVNACINSGRTPCMGYSDSCSGSSGRLNEMYCKDMRVAVKAYNCSGSCQNGACVSSSTNQTIPGNQTAPGNQTTNQTWSNQTQGNQTR